MHILALAAFLAFFQATAAPVSMSDGATTTVSSSPALLTFPEGKYGNQTVAFTLCVSDGVDTSQVTWDGNYWKGTLQLPAAGSCAPYRASWVVTASGSYWQGDLGASSGQ